MVIIATQFMGWFVCIQCENCVKSSSAESSEIRSAGNFVAWCELSQQWQFSTVPSCFSKCALRCGYVVRRKKLNDVLFLSINHLPDSK